MTTGVGKPSRLAALTGNRDFRRLWLGRAGSEFGASLTLIAIPLLAIQLTGSEVVAGLMGTVGFLAMWLAQLPGGYIADMFDRRKVMLWCDALRATVFGAFVISLLTGHGSVWGMLVVCVVGSALSVIFGAAQGQATRQIVPPDQIPEAVGITQARGFAISLVGPSAGGALFALGRVVPFALDALSYLVSMLFIWRIKTPLLPESRPAVRRLLPDIGKGWSVLWRHPYLRAKTAYSVVTNVAVSALMYVLIIGNADNSVMLGLSVSGAAGAGLLGSLAAPFLQRRLRLRTLMVSVAVIRGGVLLLAAWSGNEILFAGTLAAVMLLGPVVSAALGTATVLLVPGDVLGRASSSSAFVGSALQPLAPLIAGFLLYAFSPLTAQLILAAGFGLVALCALTLPGLDLKLSRARDD